MKYVLKSYEVRGRMIKITASSAKELKTRIEGFKMLYGYEPEIHFGAPLFARDTDPLVKFEKGYGDMALYDRNLEECDSLTIGNQYITMSNGKRLNLKGEYTFYLIETEDAY